MGLLVLVCLVGLVVFLVVGVVLDREEPASSERRIVERLRRADAEIKQAYQQARREMNHAAGQSWRDMIDDGRG